MANRPQDARHLCRVVNCPYMAAPGPGAHSRLLGHLRRTHGQIGPRFCRTECGYRATPSEGRYTPTETEAVAGMVGHDPNIEADFRHD